MKLKDLSTVARMEIEIEVFQGELDFINECLKDVDREDHRIVDLKRRVKFLKEED